MFHLLSLVLLALTPRLDKMKYNLCKEPIIMNLQDAIAAVEVSQSALAAAATSDADADAHLRAAQVTKDNAAALLDEEKRTANADLDALIDAAKAAKA